MAIFELKTPNYSGLEYLRDYHTFGRRSDSVDTLLDYSYISKLHAIIEWREPNWFLKDVSTNGLKLNGKMIPAQKPVALTLNDVIDLAGAGEIMMKIKDLSAPIPLLINLRNKSEIIEITESVLLPNESAPKLALHFCPDREQWFSDSVDEGHEEGPYDHGDLIQISDQQWQFFLIAEDEATTQISTNQSTLDDILFRFDLSQDEESANLTLISNSGVELELGERSHHYLLVHLLRYRQQNADNVAWLDNHLLMKELGLEETHLNIQIFRARKQVASALPSVSGHSKFIERRRGALRLGINHFEIYKEGVREI